MCDDAKTLSHIEQKKLASDANPTALNDDCDCCDHMLLHVVISWSYPDVMLDKHMAAVELRTSHQGFHVVCLFVCLFASVRWSFLSLKKSLGVNCSF